MRITFTQISLHDIRCYAFHGVLPQERTVGGWYRVSLDIDYPFQEAVSSDNVDDTLDYSIANSIVLEEMKRPSQLLENVAGRIAMAIIDRFPRTREVTVSVTKENPPMAGDGGGATVQIRIKNDKSGE